MEVSALVISGKHGKGLLPIWLWIGALAFSLLIVGVFASAATVGVLRAKLSGADSQIQRQSREIKELRRQTKTLGAELEKYKETSQTLKEIKDKVFQINQRRSRLVKWSALPDRGGDWIGRIDRFLAGTPLRGQGRTFYLAAVDAGIEPRLMPAIAMVESGAGRAVANTNNYFGRRARVGWASWPTKEIAIQNQARYINKMWGRAASPHQMRGYATSPVWAAKVSSQMARI